MTIRFISIPVGQGDSFFLEKNGHSVLVDGGRSRQGFPSLYESTINQRSVNVVVCTHNDADHTMGILGFLESELICDEVWLPAIWGDIIGLLTRSSEFARNQLLSSISTMDEKVLNRIQAKGDSMLGNLGGQYAEEEPSGRNMSGSDPWTELPPARLQGSIESGERGDLARLLAADISNLANVELLRRIAQRPWSRDPHRSLCVSLLAECSEAADRILEIAKAARERGVPIRWFRYDPQKSPGGHGRGLAPVNACEVRQFLESDPSEILDLLALSVTNRRSLVFVADHSNTTGFSVLFSADSDFGFDQAIPWCRHMIITAPHHGSQQNKAAYERFDRESGSGISPVWVRSDGNFPERPGDWYLKARGSKYCTMCRGANSEKQKVELLFAQGGWMPRKNIRPCACQ